MIFSTVEECKTESCLDKLRTLRRRPQNIPHDGNDVFEAVADQINANPMFSSVSVDATSIRERVYQYACSNENTLKVKSTNCIRNYEFQNNQR